MQAVFKTLATLAPHTWALGFPLLFSRFPPVPLLGPAVPTGAHGVVYPRVMRVDWMQEQKEGDVGMLLMEEGQQRQEARQPR